MRYLIDAETVARHADPLAVVECLTDRITDPKWSRQRACYGCHNWDTRWGLGNLPFRPGAGATAIESCSRCWYAMLDQAESESPTAEQHASTELRHHWLTLMGAKRLPSKRKSSRQSRSWIPEEGKAGKRDQKASSFARRKPAPATHPCPGCRVEYPVERFWLLGKLEQEAVQMLQVRCPDCGTGRWEWHG